MLTNCPRWLYASSLFAANLPSFPNLRSTLSAFQHTFPIYVKFIHCPAWTCTILSITLCQSRWYSWKLKFNILFANPDSWLANDCTVRRIKGTQFTPGFQHQWIWTLCTSNHQIIDNIHSNQAQLSLTSINWCKLYFIVSMRMTLHPFVTIFDMLCDWWPETRELTDCIKIYFENSFGIITIGYMN